MRHDPRIINLHDKPQSRRSYQRHTVPPSSSFASAILICVAIAGCVAAFFWVYDAMAHRGPSIVLARGVGANPHSAMAAAKLVPPEVPAPDLHSPAVALANADVPSTPAEPQAATAKDQAQMAPEKPKRAEPPPKKRRVHVAKRLPPAAVQAYAFEPRFFRPPFGGF
jgi:hypothetical protein